MALLPFVLALAIGTPVDTNVTTLTVFKNGYGSVSERGEAVTDHGWVDIPEAPQASFDLIWLSVPDPGYIIDRAISSLRDQAVATEPLPGTHQALATTSFAVNPPPRPPGISPCHPMMRPHSTSVILFMSDRDSRRGFVSLSHYARPTPRPAPQVRSRGATHERRRMPCMA